MRSPARVTPASRAVRIRPGSPVRVCAPQAGRRARAPEYVQDTVEGRLRVAGGQFWGSKKDKWTGYVINMPVIRPKRSCAVYYVCCTIPPSVSSRLVARLPLEAITRG